MAMTKAEKEKFDELKKDNAALVSVIETSKDAQKVAEYRSALELAEVKASAETDRANALAIEAGHLIAEITELKSELNAFRMNGETLRVDSTGNESVSMTVI